NVVCGRLNTGAMFRRVRSSSASSHSGWRRCAEGVCEPLGDWRRNDLGERIGLGGNVIGPTLSLFGGCGSKSIVVNLPQPAHRNPSGAALSDALLPAPGRGNLSGERLNRRFTQPSLPKTTG